MRHIISILLENEAGALSRVAGLFSARNYNIESLSVAATEDPTLSRMTIVTSGSERVIEQINKQLNKLIDVAAVMDLNEGDHLERELMLVKVRAAAMTDPGFKLATKDFQGVVIDETDGTCTIELTETSARLDEYLQLIKRELILETVRTGASGIGRGERILKF